MVDGFNASPRMCASEGCERPAHARGRFCSACYKRRERAGISAARPEPDPPAEPVTYSLQLPADLVAWLEAQGGVAYVLEVLEAIRELADAPTVPVTFAGAFRPVRPSDRSR